eukprot:52704_1
MAQQLAAPNEFVDKSFLRTAATTLLKVDNYGWNPLLFVDQHQISLCLCAHCNSICCNAAELGCEHDFQDIRLFCKDCLSNLIEDSDGKCPLNLHPNPSISLNRAIQRQISNSIAICPYSRTYKMRREAQNNNDDHAEVVDTLGNHSDQKEGRLPNASNGCSWKGTLKDLIDNHMFECTKVNNPLLVSQTRVKELRDKYAKLNQKNHEMTRSFESKVEQLQDTLDKTKCVLIAKDIEIKNLNERMNMLLSQQSDESGNKQDVEIAENRLGIPQPPSTTGLTASEQMLVDECVAVGHQSPQPIRRGSNLLDPMERTIELKKESFDANMIYQVDVSPRNHPKPIQSFNELNFAAITMNNIRLCKYTTPTPIQKYAIPCVLQKRDVMAIAPMGSGGTTAFLLALIHNLYATRKPKNQCSGGHNATVYPAAVVLAPTHECVIKIHAQARRFLYQTGLRSCVVYGGADWRKQARDLRDGVDIVIATPGRLMDFMAKGFVSMRAVRYNVLADADVMLNMPQVKHIIDDMPSKGKHGRISRQTLMFSHAFPLALQKLAQDFLDNYIFFLAWAKYENPFLDQKLLYVNENNKTIKLIDTISHMKRTNDNKLPLTLIFVEKKKEAARVERELIRSGDDAMSFHSNKSQREREHALKMFRTGKISLLVATDVASYGLDIPNVMFVINYDLPNDIDTYHRRIGRTGRFGNNINGNVISFVNATTKLQLIGPLMSFLKDSKAEIPQWFDDLHDKLHSTRGCSGYKNKYGGSKHEGYNANSYVARNYKQGQGRGRNKYNNYND